MKINQNNYRVEFLLLCALLIGQNNIVVAMDDGGSLFKEAHVLNAVKNHKGLSNQTTDFKNPQWRQNVTLVSLLFDIRKLIKEYEGVLKQTIKNNVEGLDKDNMAQGMAIEGSFFTAFFLVDKFLSSIENFKYLEMPLFDQFLSVGKALKESTLGGMILNKITSQNHNNEDDQEAMKLFNDVFTTDSFANYFDKNVKKEHEVINKDIDTYIKYSQIYSAYFIFVNHLLLAIKDFESIQNIIDNGEKHWYLKGFLKDNEIVDFRKDLAVNEFARGLIVNLDKKGMLAQVKNLLVSDKKINTMNNLLNQLDTQEKRDVLDRKFKELIKNENNRRSFIAKIIEDKEDMSFRDSLENRMENFIIDILNRMPELIQEMKNTDLENNRIYKAQKEKEIRELQEHIKEYEVTVKERENDLRKYESDRKTYNDALVDSYKSLLQSSKEILDSYKNSLNRAMNELEALNKKVNQ